MTHSTPRDTSTDMPMVKIESILRDGPNPATPWRASVTLPSGAAVDVCAASYDEAVAEARRIIEEVTGGFVAPAPATQVTVGDEVAVLPPFDGAPGLFAGDGGLTETPSESNPASVEASAPAPESVESDALPLKAPVLQVPPNSAARRRSRT